MNGYELSRSWFDFSFNNRELIKPTHTAIYSFAIEHCNRLGWKEKFGLPTTMAKEALGIKSYNTYINALYDLVEWGFIIMIEKSKNQHSANIVTLSKFDKALDKALDKAMIKHVTKQSESTSESNCSIDKQLTKNKEPIKQLTMATPENNASSLKTPEQTFELFWNHWFTFVKHKKEKKMPTFKKWKALTIEEQRKAYVQAEPYSQTKELADHKFLCIARTYLNDKLFNDEMTPDSKIEEPKDNRILYHGTPKLLNATEEYVANHLSHDQLLGGKPIINQNKHPEYNGLYYNFKSRTFHKEIQAELYVLEPWKNTITT